MMTAVTTAMRTRSHFAVQGPTGVGKSLAYLCAAVDAVARGERVVVVTSSRALQDQLAGVDLPLVHAVSPVPFRSAVLKGRANYLCAAAVSETEVRLGRGSGSAQLDFGLPDEELDEDLLAEIETILEWGASSETGDMAELRESPSHAAWSAVSVGAGECVGATNCSFASECASEAARTAAEEADIVVVNAHLYAAHVESGGAVLPPHSLVVVDEAHEFEDAVVGALAIEMSEGRLANLARVHDRCVADDPRVGTALRSAGRGLQRCLDSVLGEDTSVRLNDGPGKDLAAALASAVSAADRALNGLRRAAKAAGESSARHRIDRSVRVAEGVLDDAQTLLGDMGPGSVCWVQRSGSGRAAVRLTRIDVGATLATRAWGGEDAKTVVCCSATLDPGTARRLGLKAQYLAVDSPFDFSEQAVLYVPKVRRPSDPLWPDDVVAVIEDIVTALDGRTLALFTSHRVLRHAVEACRERMPQRRLLAQGDAPNPVLLEEFLADEHSCLFATAAFWTGVSSPGTTCSAVILDKIPFPVPTDPIIEARCDLVGDDRAFAEVSLPAAGMQLAQGVGRLIRTRTDRGVVVVCDPRLAEARYRNRLLNLLPPMRRARNRDWVEGFIRSMQLPPAPVEPAAS